MKKYNIYLDICNKRQSNITNHVNDCRLYSLMEVDKLLNINNVEGRVHIKRCDSEQEAIFIKNIFEKSINSACTAGNFITEFNLTVYKQKKPEIITLNHVYNESLQIENSGALWERDINKLRVVDLNVSDKTMLICDSSDNFRKYYYGLEYSYMHSFAWMSLYKTTYKLFYQDFNSQEDGIAIANYFRDKLDKKELLEKERLAEEKRIEKEKLESFICFSG